MKKQNKNFISSLLQRKISSKFFYSVVSIISISLISYSIVMAVNIVIILGSDSATWYGSNGSVISFSYTTPTYYINRWDNSTAIGNYFEWYYHDSVLGHYRLDWSLNQEDNVRIVDSTERCADGYGYKLWGYAYNTYYGFMDFDYSTDIFVYYCLNDGKLHGHAYNRYAGFQNFEWLTLEIFPTVSTAFINPSSDIFVNDVTSINQVDNYDGDDSNVDDNTIWWEQYNLDDTQEATFYIIK